MPMMLNKDALHRTNNRGRTPFTSKILFFVFIAAVFLLMWHFRVQMLTALGSYLVISTGIEVSDGAVILSGNMPERATAAADLFQKGLVPKLIMTRGKMSPSLADLIEKGFPLPEETDLGMIILTHEGVPREKIYILPGYVDSTIDEARSIARFAAAENLERLIVVTSNFHTRRTYLSLKHAMGFQATKVFVYPSPHSEFDPHAWWRHRRMARDLFIEYQKLLFYMASVITNSI